ncbi:MAG TPA: LPS export ABC transporter periplasmic protein LptC [Longimicrobiaceae bacterium]|nr:LPS export ABC transporter periplasmic protein LptC [Longimicrobiaceae bacterium]
MQAWRKGLLATAAFLAACQSSTGAPAGPAAPADPRQVTVGMNMKLTEEGVIKADLFADTAWSRPAETRTELKGVKLTFWDVQGKTPSRLTSRTGEYDSGTGEMIARGGVVLVVPGDKGPRTIRTEELFYHQKEDRIWSERETSFEEEGQVFVTQGFESNSRFTDIKGRDGKTATPVRVGEGGIRF